MFLLPEGNSAMTSVVIPAHDEGKVIRQSLANLQRDAGEVDITVIPNGCSDDTAHVAQAAGVKVVEISTPSKAAALNAGDAIAEGFPRVYLDADITVPAGGLKRMACVFGRPDSPLAAVPARQLDLVGRPLAVRAYFAINSRLPAIQSGLLGRGMIMLSEEGRSRFAEFPLMMADDLFVDSLFSETEKCTVESVVVTVATPRRTRDLVRRLIRVRRGNAAMRAAGHEGLLSADVRPASRLSWLRDVVAPHPWLIPAALVYLSLTTWAALWAKATPHSQEWGKDESSRDGSDRSETRARGSCAS
jgi:glycosyltransferase involved in cell wall biosynthesis